MHIFVYTNVMNDYTSGMAVVIAKTRKEADEIAKKNISSYEHWDKADCESYQLCRDKYDSGVVTSVSGGG